MGKIKINKTLFLAPLAGYTDAAFRTIAFREGVDISYSEMISSRGLVYDDKKTKEMLSIGENEGVVGVQIFGSELEILEKSTEILDEKRDIKIIDLNLGCPAPKIFKNGDGAALLKDPIKINKLLKGMRKKTDKTLSAKIRLGIDNKDNYLEIGKAVEESGVDYLIVHGRTREEFYSGKADWEAIGEIKQKLSIPVIGNGDITTPEDGKKAYDIYNVDGIMIGRGAIGNPWIFRQIKEFENTGEYKEPSISERFQIIKDHINLILEYKPERVAIPEMRKHLHSYLKGLKGSAKIKNEINSINSKEKLIEVLDRYKDTLTSSY